MVKCRHQLHLVITTKVDGDDDGEDDSNGGGGVDDDDDNDGDSGPPISYSGNPSAAYNQSGTNSSVSLVLPQMYANAPGTVASEYTYTSSSSSSHKCTQS